MSDDYSIDTPDLGSCCYCGSTRQWVDPAGHTFGKNKLLITTAAAFRTLTNGYRHHYEIAQPRLTTDK